MDEGNSTSGDPSSTFLLLSKRQRASACFGRLVVAVDNDDMVKSELGRYLVGRDAPPLQPGAS
jgi:hypothetical protein